MIRYLKTTWFCPTVQRPVVTTASKNSSKDQEDQQSMETMAVKGKSSTFGRVTAFSVLKRLQQTSLFCLHFFISFLCMLVGKCVEIVWTLLGSYANKSYLLSPFSPNSDDVQLVVDAFLGLRFRHRLFLLSRGSFDTSSKALIS